MRTFWIIWCCAWALFWMLIGFALFPLWVMVPLSLFAILLPVGKSEERVTIHRIQRPQFPSSGFDTRFTQEEIERYFNDQSQKPDA